VAVSFIHSKGMIHRNLHPNNFLIACVDPKNDSFVIKLTDFQRSKSWINNSELSHTTTKEGWMAPESLKDDDTKPAQQTSKSLDAFLLGLYYYYVLSLGEHPFGENPNNQLEGIVNPDHEVYQKGPQWRQDNPHLSKVIV